MSTKKTIQINPELFSTNKTRKKKEKVIQNKPLIKANSLKKALLKRIKHHARNRERRQENSEKKDNNKDEEFYNPDYFHPLIELPNPDDEKFDNQTVWILKKPVLKDNYNPIQILPIY